MQEAAKAELERRQLHIACQRRSLRRAILQIVWEAVPTLKTSNCYDVPNTITQRTLESAYTGINRSIDERSFTNFSSTELTENTILDATIRTLDWHKSRFSK